MKAGFAPEDRLEAVSVSEAEPRARTAGMQQELDVALYDLAEENSFRPADPGTERGPWRLTIALSERRIALEIAGAGGAPVEGGRLPLAGLREAIEDYAEVCARYLDAVRQRPREEIEAIDSDRRALHDDGGRLLAERLAGIAAVDHATARRLFSVIAALAAES